MPWTPEVNPRDRGCRRPHQNEQKVGEEEEEAQDRGHATGRAEGIPKGLPSPWGHGQFSKPAAGQCLLATLAGDLVAQDQSPHPFSHPMNMTQGLRLHFLLPSLSSGNRLLWAGRWAHQTGA